MLDLVAGFESRDLELISLTDSIDTVKPHRRLVLNIFRSLAEFEHDLIQVRTKAGLETALARSRKGGRRRKLSAEAQKRQCWPELITNRERWEWMRSLKLSAFPRLSGTSTSVCAG